MPIDFRGVAPLLGVFDMQTSVKFYRDVLGFKLVATSDPHNQNFYWAMLRGGGAEVMLNTIYDEGKRPATPEPGRTSAHRDTALFFACRDLDAAYKHLCAHRAKAEEPFVQNYGMRQLYLTDPDGYMLCFQWPTSPEVAQRWEKSYESPF